jgi:hypothetical protein
LTVAPCGDNEWKTCYTLGEKVKVRQDNIPPDHPSNDPLRKHTLGRMVLEHHKESQKHCLVVRDNLRPIYETAITYDMPLEEREWCVYITEDSKNMNLSSDVYIVPRKKQDLEPLYNKLYQMKNEVHAFEPAATTNAATDSASASIGMFYLEASIFCLLPYFLCLFPLSYMIYILFPFFFNYILAGKNSNEKNERGWRQQRKQRRMEYYVHLLSIIIS